MRDVPHIWEAWRSGVYVGDYKPSVRVTVEKSYTLRVTESVLGQWSRGPARWFQREFPTPATISARNTPQVETELPSVQSVRHESSLDTDAGTAEIVLANVLMPVLGEESEIEGQLGRPGYYSWSRGDSVEARARWGQSPNSWSRVLVPNALIRIYEGFGGEDKTIADALEDGNIVQRGGVYLVDTVRANANGTLSLSCRTVGKLLLDQQLYPPLVPRALYPLHYQRYTFETFKIPEDSVPNVRTWSHTTGFDPPVDLGPMASSTNEFGHTLQDAIDINFDTYWLSEGKASPTDEVFIEFYMHGAPPINQVTIHPWAGNYEVYVSIYENGEWVAPEESVLGGLAPGSGVPYVNKYGVGWEKIENLGLPRQYSCERVRLTFTNLTASQEGGYRAGVRTFFGQNNRLFVEYPVYVFASAAIPYNESNIEGYWQVRSNGKVYAFGDARVHPKSADVGYGVPADSNYGIIGMAAAPDGFGYWIADMKGRVNAFGSAGYYGDLFDEPGFAIVDIAPGFDGYWLLEKDGTVSAFGSATHFGDATVSGTMPSGGQIIARSIESTPTGGGYWVLRTDGQVQAFGDAVDYGDANRSGFTDTEYVASIRRTSTGLGYWITSGNGIVQAFGDAPHPGNGYKYPPEKWAQGLCWDLIPWSGGDGGYAVQHADGTLDVCGDFGYYGSVGAGEGQLRKDGNYKDYADIIRDLLLWSGFYLYRFPAEVGQPAVFGNIETTGAYSKLPLPDEMFDKRPVMEAITAIKEIVGYIFYIDDEGGAHFESPNWWTIGNFDQYGQRIDLMPEIDEVVNLTDYQTETSDAEARSEITIASAAPTADFKGTIVSTIVPPSARDLKGLVKPAIWANGNFDDEDEQYAMAELIAMHIWFARRQSSTTCVANPLIGINDQVRIYERVTGETYVHHVRGVATTWDAKTGSYEMVLTTHWLGGTPTTDLPMFYAAAMMPDGLGYFQAGSDGGVFAFGSAQLHEPNEDDTHSEDLISIRVTPSGAGYWTLDSSGKVISYGDAEHFGHLSRSDLDVRDFAITPSGNGYWILLENGGIWNFGDATDHSSPIWGGTLPNRQPIRAASLESHPTEDGLWVLYTDGTVLDTGTGTFPDQAPPIDGAGAQTADHYRIVRSNQEGNGVYVVSAKGRVEGLGDDVPDFGNAVAYPPEDATFGAVWAVMPVRFSGDQGYAIQHADGQLDFFADFPYEGAVGANSGYTGKSRSSSWALTTRDQITRAPEKTTNNLLAVSDRVIEMMKRSSSPSAQEAIATDFGQADEVTLKARSE